MTRSSGKSGGNAGKARSTARLHAVQALYQIDFGDGQKPRTVMEQFTKFRIGDRLDEDIIHAADKDFFKDLVEGVVTRISEIDGAITPLLKKGWKMSRLDPTLRNILRAGAYELIARPDVPTKVIVNEYVDIAHAFMDEREAGFANGILDAMAKSLRG